MKATNLNKLGVSLNKLFHMVMIGQKSQVTQGVLSNQSSFNYFSYNESYHLNQNTLRGGGCIKSKLDNVIDIKQKSDQNLMISSKLPDNYRTDLNDSLNVIIEGAKFIGDSTKKNEIIMKLQWFIHNREYLNYFCIDQRETSKVYELVQENFENLLNVLTTYLRASGFICYQILQICNELLRIMYAFQLNNSQRCFQVEIQQDYLQKLSEFNNQVEIEKANVWKTGIEFELTIMKIMLMNSQTNSTEGADLLIDFFKEAGKSIISFSPTEDLLQTIINGGQYLLKKGIEQSQYPKETYQIYYFFQLIKWSIIRQLKSKQSVYKQIQQLKDVFQQYIQVSNNWILHFCWIQMITDILAYRPIIDKSLLIQKQPNQASNKWNILLENDLVKCVSYDKNQAIMTLFQNESVQIHDIEINNFLEIYGKKKFVLFIQFLLKGDYTQNMNHWDFYKKFIFKYQKEKNQEQHEIILANYEQEILQKLFNNLKSQKDDLISIYQQILQSLHNNFKQNSQIPIQIIQDDLQVSLKQFLVSYKKLIIFSNYIQELSLFEATKLNMLNPYINEFNLQQNKTKLLENQNKVNNFAKIQLKEFIDQLLNLFINAIEFSSVIYEVNTFLTMKIQKDLDKMINRFNIDNFQNMFLAFETNFIEFTLNLNSFKQNFVKLIQKQNKNLLNIQLQAENIGQIIQYNCQGQWIQNIIRSLKKECQEKFGLFNTQMTNIEDVQQIFITCQFNIQILSFLKQFYNIQNHYLQKVKQQIQDYNNQIEPQKEQEDENFKAKAAEILIKQKQKFSQLFNSTIQESDDKNFKAQCKSLVGQIQSDFDIISNESQNFQNIDQCGMLLKFFTEIQFVVLQVQNQPDELSTLKDFILKYDQTLEEINKFNEINNQKIQKGEDQNDESIQIIFLILQKNDQIQKLIKQSNKYFKSYKNLLQLGLNLIYKQQILYSQMQIKIQQNTQQETSNEEKLKLQDQLVQLQSQQSQNISLQIKELKEKSEKFFSIKVKAQIKQMIDFFLLQEEQNEQKIIINLKLPEFLQFFYIKSHQEYSQGLKVDTTSDSIWQDIKNSYDEIKEKLLDSIDLKLDFKVREALVYNLIRLQQSIQEQQINSFASKYIQYLWVFEKDQRVRNLLKNKELIQIQKQLFSQDLDSLSVSMKDEIKERLSKLENLQKQIKLEGNSQKREQLQLELKNTYDEIDESLDNIQEMSEAMDISLLFLKDISKDVKQIKGQIDKLQDSINQVGDDIRKLRGKNYKELLDMRKEKILLQSKLTEVDSVYVQLMTIKYDPVTGQVIKTNNNAETSLLMAEKWNDFTGEINEFIWDESQQKDALLLSGYAGSGKSKAARKIEEFIWKQKGSNSKWTPIFVSLPTLKNPKQNLFDQALESENYQFDKYQIRELKEAIQSKKEYIILILDSYDEMKQECIQSNLILTNKLFQDLSIDKVNSQMKVIITTRKEILNTVGYQTWFYGESLSKLKEIQLQNFDQNQQQEYLNQYVELSVKRKIKESYEFIKLISGQNFDLSEFLDIWNMISKQVKNCINKSMDRKQDKIFQNKEEEFIVEKIKTHKILEVLKDEQKIALRKELLALWSANKYRAAIESVKIQDLLTTPFMLEIIVQVLPNMTKKYSGSTEIKEILIQNYIKLKQQIRLSQSAREQYKKIISSIQDQQQQPLINLDEEQVPEKDINGQYQANTEKKIIEQIIDNLEDQKFFQNYSIVSVLNQQENTIILDGIRINLNSDDINIILMALKMKKFTVFEFYESFINFYHEQQIQKQRELGKIPNYESFIFDINQFSCSLAIDMTLKDLSQIGYKPQGKLDLKSNYKIEQVIDDWLKQYFDVEDEYKKLIRSCILLSAKGSTYSFTHKSIQEFYVAKYIFDLLMSLNNIDSIMQFNQKFEQPQQNIKNNNDKIREIQNNDSEQPQQNTQNKIDQNREYNNDNAEQYKDILLKSLFNYKGFILSSDKYRGVINFIKEKLMNTENMNEKLIKIVKLSKFKNSDYSRAASNSIYLLNQMNAYLGSQDFNNIKLINTNISGLSLFDSDLSFSEFQNVEINSCNLNLADLSNVNWQNVICKEKPLLKGHTQSVIEVQFSPNGQYIASAASNQIKIWNAQNFSFIQDLDGHTANVNTLSFSQDSLYLYSGSDDQNILRWDLQNQQQKNQWIQLDKMKNKVRKVQISQDQKKLYSQDLDGNFQILDLSKDGNSEECVLKIEKKFIQKFVLHPTEPIVAVIYQISELDLINYQDNTIEKLGAYLNLYKDRVINLVFSQDGNQFAIATQSSVLIYNITKNTSDNKIIINFSNISLSAFSFGQNSNQLVFGAIDFIIIQDIESFNIKSQEKKSSCYEIQMSPIGNLAAVVYDKQVCIQDTMLGQTINSIKFDLQPYQIHFSKDGSKLSLFLKEGEVIKQFNILEVLTLTIVCFIPWNENYWIRYILSPNFKQLYILYDNYSKLIQNENYQQLEQSRIQKTISVNTSKIHKNMEIKKFNIQVAMFSVKPNTQIIAYTSSEVASIKIFDFEQNQQIQEDIENEKKAVQSFQFSPIKNELAVSYVGEFIVWNLDSKPFKVQGKINLSDQIIKSMNYSSDGSLIAFVFQDQFRIYDITNCTLQKVVEQKQIEGKVQFSLDNNLIGYYSKNQILISSKNKNYEQKVLDGHKSEILKLQFTQDQKHLVSGSSEELILWDCLTYQIKIRRSTNLKDIRQIIFSNNTNQIALFQSGAVELWRYSEDNLICIGSQVFDTQIKQLNFTNDDQKLMILNKNSELILCNIDIFQFEKTFDQSFDCGAISSNDLIALVQGEQINVFCNDFEKCNYSLKGGQNMRQIKFFENKENLILIHQDKKIKVLDYVKGCQISEIESDQNIESQLYLKDEILIEQNENSIKIWNIVDLSKIKLCGYHEEITNFSIQENGEFGVGIKDQQEFILKNIFNVPYAFPKNSNQYITQIYLSAQKQFCVFLTFTKKLFIFYIDSKQLYEFDGEINAMAFCQKNNCIAIYRDSKVQLVVNLQDNISIIDTFEIQDKITACILQFTGDGQGLLLSSYYMIRIFQITTSYQLVCKMMHYWLEKNQMFKDAYIKQAQIIQSQNLPKKSSLLAILDQEQNLFRIIDIQKSKQILFVKSKINYNMFQLSLDEELICFVNDYVQLTILENKNMIIKKIENVKIEGFSRSYHRAVGKDSFVYVTKKNEIMKFSKSSGEVSLIGTTKNDINCLIYLPKQDWLALSTNENSIMFWDVKAKKNVGILQGHQKTINSMSVSFDGSCLVSASDDRLLKLWNINENQSLEIKKAHSYSISALAISQDGFYLASGSVKGQEVEVPVFVWDIREKLFITQLFGHKDSVNCLEFSKCDKYLFSGSKNGKIMIWNIEYPQATEVLYVSEEFNFPVSSLSFSPKDQMLLTFNSDNIQKWNVNQFGKQENLISLNTNSKQYCFYQDMKFIYVQEDKDQLAIVNFETKKQEILEQNSKVKQILISQDDSYIICLSQLGEMFCWSKSQDNKWIKKFVYLVTSSFILLSPDNQFLFQAKDCTSIEKPLFSDAFSERFRVLFHDFQKLINTEEVFNYQFEKNKMLEIIISSDLKQFAIIQSQEFQIFNANNWQCTKEFKGCSCYNKPQMSRDNKYLAFSQDRQKNGSNQYDNVISILEIDNPSNLCQLEVKECKLKIYQFFNQDSNRIYALYSDGTLRDWNVKTKSSQIVVTLSETIQKNIMIFSQKLKFLIYQSQNNQQILLWDFIKKEKSSLDVGEEFYLIACSQNEDIFAVTISKGVKIFKGSQETIIYVYDDLNLYYVTQISFSQDDKQLLFCQDQTIYLYQIEETLNNKILGCWNVQSQILQCVYNSVKQEAALKLNNQIIVLNVRPTLLKSELLSIENEKAACFSPDSKYLASLIPSLQLQELQNLQVIHNFESYNGDLISFQSQGILVIANRNKLIFLNITRIDKIIKFKEFSYQYKIIDFSLTKNYSLIQFKDDFKRIKTTFNSITNNESNQFKGIYNSQGKPIFSLKGNYFALSNEKKIQIINAENIKQENCFQFNQKIENGKLINSPDGKFIYISVNKSIQIIDSKSFKKVNEIQLDSEPTQLEISQNFKYFAVACSNSVSIYTLINQEKLFEYWTIKGDQHQIKAIDLSPKGDYLLTAGLNMQEIKNVIALWKNEQQKQICKNDKINNEVKVLKFCPNGVSFVAGLSDGSINLYSIDIQQTNFYKNNFMKGQNQNDEVQQFQIVCFKTFAKYSLLSAQQCILENACIQSEQKSILKLFDQKNERQE